MSQRFVIPTNAEQLNNEAKLIVRTAGTFGVRQTLFNTMLPDNAKNYDVDKKFSKLPATPTFDTPKIDTKSYLGTPVFSNFSAVCNGVTVNIDTALFVVSMTKNIITTPIQGRNGTVKEYISDGDFQVTIKGVLSGEKGQFPQYTSMTKTSLQDLKMFCEASKVAQVNSWYLNNLGINYLVVQSYKFEQNEGEYGLVPFEISCLSEQKYDVIISK